MQEKNAHRMYFGRRIRVSHSYLDGIRNEIFALPRIGKAGNGSESRPAARQICQKSLRILKALRHKAGISDRSRRSKQKDPFAHEILARCMVLEPIIPQKAW
jgi:hypothetical protein